jgi:hypothetical protein
MSPRRPTDLRKLGATDGLDTSRRPSSGWRAANVIGCLLPNPAEFDVRISRGMIQKLSGVV